MPRKPSKVRPRISQRPFPWRCANCGKRAVHLSRVKKYEAAVRHDGRLYSFTVPEIECPICDSCGAKVFTEAVDQQIATAFRVHAHLLLPQQIREAIQRVGAQQKEISRHLGLAEETLSRWLSESQIQSRSMDTLLRIYFAFPEVRHVLAGKRERADLGLSDVDSRSRPRCAARAEPAARQRRSAPSDSAQQN